ncbi:MAG: GIY-YIG nuclease family protein [Candidatus Dojkabacteria bacterium]
MSLKNSPNNPFTVYILQCSDGTFYTGVAKDLEKRLEVHKSGKGSKYVRARLPFKLIYSKVYANKVGAMQEEYRIKQLSKLEKLELIKRSVIIF